VPRLTFVVGVIAAIFIVYFAALYLLQRSLLYPIPQRQPNLAEGVPRGEVVRFTAPGASTYGFFLRARAPAPAPLIIYSHGNAEIAADWLGDFREVQDWASALLVEYPGYGGADGAPTERSIIDTMLAAYDWGAKNPAVDPFRVVAYGRSLGGGAAARLAVDRKVAGLILESSFTSVADLASRLLAPRFLVQDVFDNRAALRAYRGPVLVIHGSHDTIVPIAHARELATLASGARVHEIDCGHNDCPRQWPVIRRFLEHANVLSDGDPP
jgi:uncharacterized protein